MKIIKIRMINKIIRIMVYYYSYPYRIVFVLLVPEVVLRIYYHGGDWIISLRI
jgi:hypothetical protein